MEVTPGVEGPSPARHFELQYVVDPNEWARVVSFQPVRTRLRRRQQLIGTGFVGLGVLEYLVTTDAGAAVGRPLAFAALTIGLLLLRFSMRSAVERLLRKSFVQRPNAGQVTRVRIDADGIYQELPTSRSEYRWGHWSELFVHDDAVLLSTAGFGLFLVIPSRAVVAEEWPELVRFLEVHVTRAGRT